MSNSSFNKVFEETVPYTVDDDNALLQLARKGVSKKSVTNLSKIGELPLKTLASLLPVTERTLQRYTDEDRLSPDVSEHIILITKVLFRAEEVLGSMSKARQWLKTPSVALGNEPPLSFLDTVFGAQLVMDELGRVESGVYS